MNFLRPSSVSRCEIDQLSYTTHAGARLTFISCRQPRNAKRGWNFEFQDCSELIFLNQDLARASFLGSVISKTLFESCTWPKLPTENYVRVYLHDEVVRSGKKEELEALEALYRQLKQNQEATRNYIEAGDFHFREKDIRQKLLKGQKGKGVLRERVILWFYKGIADFGESYVKLWVWMVLSIISGTAGVALVEEILGASDWQFKWCESFRTTCILDPLQIFLKSLEPVGFVFIPSGFQRQAFSSDDPLFWLSKLVILILGLWLLLLATLLVMAIRRRFRH